MAARDTPRRKYRCAGGGGHIGPRRAEARAIRQGAIDRGEQVVGFVEGENRQAPRCIVLSRKARRALDAEWDRCRWLWNECVAKSRHVHAQSRAGGEKLTCGPAQLGVVEALDQILLPTCVASSSTHAGLRHTLGLTGL